jgi:hypothetical protein
MFNGIQMKHFIGIQTKLAPHWHQNTAGVRSAVLEGNISAVLLHPAQNPVGRLFVAFIGSILLPNCA